MRLVERDGVLADLCGEANAAQRESGRAIMLAGAAGVGKTSVVRELVERMHGRLRVLWGCCDPLSTPRVLGPLHDMVASAALAVDLAAVTDRHRVFAEVLDELSSGSLMIVEDVHWADDATLDLVRFIGRRIDRTRSIVVATFRADEVDADHQHPLRPVLGELATAPGHRRISVEPLTIDGVRDLAGESPVDADHLFRITGGNPFFVTEVLAAPGWTVPATVVDAVLCRVARLAHEVRSVLETAAVEPGPVEFWLLRQLGHPEEVINRACRSGMLVAGSATATFRHELARLALESTLDVMARRNLHRLILTALEHSPRIDPARLSHHAVGAGDDEKVVRWATAAGHVAAASGAHRQAMRQYERAVEHAGALSAEELADLLTRYARELITQDCASAHVAVWRRIVELRRSIGDPAATEEANAELANALCGAGDSAAANRVITEAVEAVDQLNSPVAAARIYDRAGHLALIDRRGRDAVELAQRAVTVAEDEGLESIMLASLNVLGAAKLVASEDPAGIADLERSARIARDHSLHDLHANALEHLGWALCEIRHYDEAAGYLADLFAYAAHHDVDKRRRHGTAWLARIRFEQGHWSEATELANEAMAGGGDPMPIIPLVAMTVIGRVRARRGDPGSRAALAQAWALACTSGGLHRLWPVAAGRAELAWLTGTDPNVDEIAETLGLAESLGLRWAIGELGYWAWQQGTVAQPPANAAEPYRLQIVGRPLQAAAAWEAIGCPYEQAIALAACEDEPSLRSALTILRDLGARPLADRVNQQLRSLGATRIPGRPRPATSRHPAGLTQRQAEVVELVTEGLSDREIAQRLWISERTANHHVAAVLLKLHAHSRSQAAARWRRLSQPAS